MRYVIAEIGSNFAKYVQTAKNLDCAKRQIDGAVEVGADAVKFQLYTCQELYGPEVEGSAFEYQFNQNAMPKEFVPQLAAYAEAKGIDFMCSAFSVDGFKYVDPFVKMHKLASCEATAVDIVEWLMSQPKPVIYSDGCNQTLDFGRYSDIRMACVTNYPAEPWEYDLEMPKGPDWGLSDHTLTNDLAILSLAKGCTYFEKHVDFLKNEGKITPDSGVSIGKDAFKDYVKAIKSFDLTKHQELKQNLNKEYARIQTEHGYFRPIPKGVDLAKIWTGLP